MNGKSNYRLRSFGQIEMYDEVDCSTGQSLTITSKSDNEMYDTAAAAPETNCGLETTDCRVTNPTQSTTSTNTSSVNSANCSTSNGISISNVNASSNGFVPYHHQSSKSDLLDSKGGKLNICDLLNLKKSKVKPSPDAVPCLSQPPAHLDYFMEHERRGKCVIINNRRFDSPSLHERKGTEVDGKHLAECFKKLDFDIDLIEDKKAKEIRSAIHSIASQDFSNDDCFICCVLTHGELNSLWARDERYMIDLILEPFRGDNCKTLAGKPKLFFIQACQGDKLDRGMTVRFDDVEDSTSTSFFRIPTWADFLIAFSTVPGYYSWRNTTNGSWFVQALVSTMNEHWETHDLLSILTITSHRVAYKFESFVPNDPEFDKKKQIPCVKSMLTRRIFFKPKPSLTNNTSSVEENTESLIRMLNEKNSELKVATDSQLKLQLKINRLNQEISLLQQHLHQMFVQREIQKLNLNGKNVSKTTTNSMVATASTSTATSGKPANGSTNSTKVEVVQVKAELIKKSGSTQV